MPQWPSLPPAVYTSSCKKSVIIWGMCLTVLSPQRWSTKAFTISNMTPIWIFPVSLFLRLWADYFRKKGPFPLTCSLSSSKGLSVTNNWPTCGYSEFTTAKRKGLWYNCRRVYTARHWLYGHNDDICRLHISSHDSETAYREYPTRYVCVRWPMRFHCGWDHRHVPKHRRCTAERFYGGRQISLDYIGSSCKLG